MKKELREIVYRKYKGHCGYCGQEIKYKDMQVDHIIPQACFVSRIHNAPFQKHEYFKIPQFLEHLKEEDCEHIDNLMPACRSCNNWKNTFSLDGFRREVSLQIERLNKYSANYRNAKRFGLVEETGKEVVFYFEKVSCEQT